LYETPAYRATFQNGATSRSIATVGTTDLIALEAINTGGKTSLDYTFKYSKNNKVEIYTAFGSGKRGNAKTSSFSELKDGKLRSKQVFKNSKAIETQPASLRFTNVQ
jgi:hypothetical protein